jgi:hypothetical protein
MRSGCTEMVSTVTGGGEKACLFESLLQVPNSIKTTIANRIVNIMSDRFLIMHYPQKYYWSGVSLGLRTMASDKPLKKMDLFVENLLEKNQNLHITFLIFNFDKKFSRLHRFMHFTDRALIRWCISFKNITTGCTSPFLHLFSPF